MNPRELQIARNSEILKKYIPHAAVSLIADWVIDFDFKLKITKERSTRYGDYSSPRNGLNHVITINYNLNQYAFLITLVHEIAHLDTFNKHKDRVQPHGNEWKWAFIQLMQPFLNTEVFPVDLLYAVRQYLKNPAASSCSDQRLMRALKLYDNHNNGKIFLDYLPENATFMFNGSRLFVKGKKIRTRIECKEIVTGTTYLFNALTEVEVFDQSTVD
ncbi:MAG: SprT-like domain-containing protein [Bacteroidia bacterium]